VNQIEFKVLQALLGNRVSTQRDLAGAAGVSLGAANKAIAVLRERGLVVGMVVTETGRAVLEP